MTVRNRARASSPPRRCSRSISLSALTSNITSPRGSSRRAPRARTEKDSSRRAEGRVETVSRGGGGGVWTGWGGGGRRLGGRKSKPHPPPQKKKGGPPVGGGKKAPRPRA